MPSNENPPPGPPPPPLELLAVSFTYPPLAYTRAVQVARLLKYLRASTVMVCADEEKARRDPEIEPHAERFLRACLRVPFSLKGWRRVAAGVAERYPVPLWNKSPDHYTAWKPAALRAVTDYARSHRYRPDALVTFAQPMSDHLVGLELKRRYAVPWVAHFSDPWVGNAFSHYNHDFLTRRRNLSLEGQVVAAADRLVFTSQETIELVLSKYPAAWKDKARVLPQCFDTALFPEPAAGRDASSTIIRYTGEFYGRRTPNPLIRALSSLASSHPALLAGVRFELIGDVEPGLVIDAALESLPAGLVSFKPTVNYRESLQLMSSADGLLIIDAPAEESVFLPSKLIEYVGAARPILGLTPKGAAATLIKQLGGWAADPSDVAAMAAALEIFLVFLHRHRDERRAWGEPEVRKAYEAPTVAATFEEIVGEALA